MLIWCAKIKISFPSNGLILVTSISLQMLKECSRPWEQLCLWTAPFNKYWCLIWLLLGWSKLNTFTEIICSMTKITQLITLFFSEGVVNGQCETLWEGKTSVFHCEPEALWTFQLQDQSVLNASTRCSHSKKFICHLWKQTKRTMSLAEQFWRDLWILWGHLSPLLDKVFPSLVEGPS